MAVMADAFLKEFDSDETYLQIKEQSDKKFFEDVALKMREIGREARLWVERYVWHTGTARLTWVPSNKSFKDFWSERPFFKAISKLPQTELETVSWCGTEFCAK